MKNKKQTVLTADIGANPTDPEWIKLHRKNMELNNKGLDLSIRQQEVSILDTRIENARRNVQLLGSLCFQCYDKSDPVELRGFGKEAMEILLLNLKILRETENIK